MATTQAQAREPWPSLRAHEEREVPPLESGRLKSTHEAISFNVITTSRMRSVLRNNNNRPAFPFEGLESGSQSSMIWNEHSRQPSERDPDVHSQCRPRSATWFVRHVGELTRAVKTAKMQKAWLWRSTMWVTHSPKKWVIEAFAIVPLLRGLAHLTDFVSANHSQNGRQHSTIEFAHVAYRFRSVRSWSWCETGMSNSQRKKMPARWPSRWLGVRSQWEALSDTGQGAH